MISNRPDKNQVKPLSSANRPTSQIRFNNSKQSNSTARLNRPATAGHNERTSKGGGIFKVGMMISTGVMFILVIMVFIWWMGQKPVQYTRIFCPHCQSSFQIPTKEYETIKDNVIIECTKCKGKVILDEEKAKNEAERFVYRARDLVNQSNAESNPDKVDSLRAEAKESLKKALEIYELVPAAKTGYAWELYQELVRELRSRRHM